MFNKKSDAGYRTARPGVNFRTLAFGERTHLTEFRLAKGSIIPKHEHPHEQTGYLVSGRMTFSIAGEAFDTRPGDGWNSGTCRRMKSTSSSGRDKRERTWF